MRHAGQLCLAFGIWLSIGAFVSADDLPQRIDKLIAAGAKGLPPGPLVDDAQFVRRVYLDLAGRIPTAKEATGFITDKEAAKRAKLVDALLASPDYVRRMRDLFNIMLMERRGDNPEWSKFLEKSFEANKPWDQLVREIIDPEPTDELLRGAAFFYTKRLEKIGQQDTDYPGLTRDVGRLFLGMDLQCAQCHNHLSIDYYKQEDFQGLFTVYQNTFIRNDMKFPAIGEKLMTEKKEYMSVFDKVPLTVGPRVPGGKEIEIPKFEKGQEYAVPPDKQKKGGVPKFSPLEAIAHELPTAGNQAFLNNVVNRLWFVMMGRGLVNPLDQQHAANPPSHPELMALLADEFKAHQFNIQWLLAELAKTETYQRSSILPTSGEVPPPESFVIANEKRLSGEQIAASVLIAAGTQGASPATAETPPEAAATSPLAEKEETKDEPKSKGAKKTDAQSIRAAFVKAFANSPADPEVEFTPSLKTALFVLNDPIMLDSLAPQPGNLVDRLTKVSDPNTLADELYLCVLTRTPTEEERTIVREYLGTNADRRTEAIINLAWSLLGSTEFCLNH